MTPSIKTISVLTWVMAVGADISSISAEKTDKSGCDFDKIKIAAKGVRDAANDALNLWKKVNLKRQNQIKIAENIIFFDSIGYVKANQKKLEILIALMLAGTEDLLEHITNHARRLAVGKLVDSLMALSLLIDPDGTETAHYIRGDHAYQRWVNS